MFFILCYKILLIRHILAFFETSGMKEVRILLLISRITVLLPMLMLILMLTPTFGNEHYIKYRNFTYFRGVEILWKGKLSAEFRPDNVPFCKTSTPGN